MGGVAVGAMLAGSVVQGLAQYQASRYNAAIADLNATIMRNASLDATARGVTAAGRALTRGGQVMGAATAQAGGSGVSVSSPSVQGVLATTKSISEIDAATIKNNALREALGYETKALSYQTEAEQARRAGSSALLGTLLTVGGKAVSTAYGSGFPNFNKGGGVDAATYDWLSKGFDSPDNYG